MVKYSRVYKVSDLSKKDMDFLTSNEFCCACSDDLEQIAQNPERCRKGIVGFVSGDVFGCHVVFEDTTKEGFCWGGYDFGVVPFKYVRIAINPYGDDEFTCLPSEQN